MVIIYIFGRMQRMIEDPDSSKKRSEKDSSEGNKKNRFPRKIWSRPEYPKNPTTWDAIKEISFFASEKLGYAWDFSSDGAAYTYDLICESYSKALEYLTDSLKTTDADIESYRSNRKMRLNIANAKKEQQKGLDQRNAFIDKNVKDAIQTIYREEDSCATWGASERYQIEMIGEAFKGHLLDRNGNLVSLTEEYLNPDASYLNPSRHENLLNLMVTTESYSQRNKPYTGTGVLGLSDGTETIDQNQKCECQHEQIKIKQEKDKSNHLTNLLLQEEQKNLKLKEENQHYIRKQENMSQRYDRLKNQTEFENGMCVPKIPENFWRLPDDEKSKYIQNIASAKRAHLDLVTLRKASGILLVHEKIIKALVDVFLWPTFIFDKNSSIWKFLSPAQELNFMQRTVIGVFAAILWYGGIFSVILNIFIRMQTKTKTKTDQNILEKSKTIFRDKYSLNKETRDGLRIRGGYSELIVLDPIFLFIKYMKIYSSFVKQLGEESKEKKFRLIRVIKNILRSEYSYFIISSIGLIIAKILVENNLPGQKNTEIFWPNNNNNTRELEIIKNPKLSFSTINNNKNKILVKTKSIKKANKKSRKFNRKIRRLSDLKTLSSDNFKESDIVQPTPTPTKIKQGKVWIINKPR